MFYYFHEFCLLQRSECTNKINELNVFVWFFFHYPDLYESREMSGRWNSDGKADKKVFKIYEKTRAMHCLLLQVSVGDLENAVMTDR